MNFVFLGIGAGLLAVVFGAYQIVRILALPTGTPNMVAISDAIAEGAQAYLKRQYTVVAGIAAIIFIILWILQGPFSAFAFLIGATLSATAGFVGMNVSVRTNVRVTEAAKKGLSPALTTAFAGGSVTGLMVAGLALLAISVTYLLLQKFGVTTLNPLGGTWLWRIFDFCFCQAWRRNLYQRCRRWNRHGW